MKEQVIQQLRLVDGKFMRGDVEEPVQIGRKVERENQCGKYPVLCRL